MINWVKFNKAHLILIKVINFVGSNPTLLSSNFQYIPMTNLQWRYFNNVDTAYVL